MTRIAFILWIASIHPDAKVMPISVHNNVRDCEIAALKQDVPMLGNWHYLCEPVARSFSRQ